LAVDSIFMMPQLGVLANIDKESLSKEARKAALEVFHKDCLIRLGTCITPVGKTKSKALILTADLTFTDGTSKTIQLREGDFIQMDAPHEPIKAKLTPAKKMDIGGGVGEIIQTEIYGGVTGLVFDGRGRPLDIPTDQGKRLELLRKWSEAVSEYPDVKAIEVSI
ncbi:MAG: hypothetical protein HOG68_03525, partial [Candidatus Marinimicrobia bacterium]|nr:hypothetical protein [Candidatus Neomarinimicrobiota bacterium]